VAPEAYGLVAMTAIITALGTVLQNMGFTSALVQRKELTENDTTSVFITNVLIGALIAVLLMIYAEPIALFFDREEIVVVVQVNAIALFLASLGIVQTAILQREYRFRTGLLIEVITTLLAGASALVAALQGLEVGALLLLIIVREASRTFLLWMLIRWRPNGSFSLASMKSLWGYARHMIGASLYHNFATNLSAVLLGKFYSPTVLGLFSRAQSLQNLPVGLITQPVQRVAFPLYSRHQTDLPELCRILRQHSRSVAVLGGIVTAGLATCANELVLILVGDAWIQSVAMLQILAFAAFFNVTFPLHSEANKAIGESRWFFWIEMSKKTFLVAMVAIGILNGITWLLWLIVLSSVVDYMLSAMSSVRYIGYSWRQQAADIGPALGVTFVAILAAQFAAEFLTDPGLLLGLFVKGSIVLTVFGIAILVIGSRKFPEIHSLFMRLVAQAAQRLGRQN
jgi:teichuronic acid exporter